MIRVKERAKRWAHAAAEPLVQGLIRLGVKPDHITILGCFLSLVAALAFFEGEFRWGAALIAFSGFCDILDGELARESRGLSTFGAFLDSTLDRFSEAVILAGIAGFYVFHLFELILDPSLVMSEVSHGLEPRTWVVITLTAMAALIGSFLVSYTRARAEGLGVACRVGWFERPERLLLLIVAASFGVGPVMPGALMLLTVLSFTTASQRVVHVWKSTRAR